MGRKIGEGILALVLIALLGFSIYVMFAKPTWANDPIPSWFPYLLGALFLVVAPISVLITRAWRDAGEELEGAVNPYDSEEETLPYAIVAFALAGFVVMQWNIEPMALKTTLFVVLSIVLFLLLLIAGALFYIALRTLFSSIRGSGFRIGGWRRPCPLYVSDYQPSGFIRNARQKQPSSPSAATPPPGPRRPDQ